MPVSSIKKAKFEDYDGFVEKFKPKKTTDDCYTPQPVYDEILRWVDEKIMKLEGHEIVRPFWPGNDYQNYDYPDNCIVIDNPPFSIITKICKYYNDKGIKYFLFAPSLTLFSGSSPDNESYIVSHADVVYENGAKVRTSFRTNLLGGDPKIMVAGDLHKRIASINGGKQPKHKRIISYPDHLISGALLGRLCVRGICFDIPRSDCAFVRRLDQGIEIFGAGYLLSERAAAERAAAERAAAERAAAERAAAERAMLSEREWEIIKKLGDYDH